MAESPDFSRKEVRERIQVCIGLKCVIHHVCWSQICVIPYQEPATFDELFCTSIKARSCLYDKGDENYLRSDVVDAA